jgi:hypothetical protein
VNARTHIGWLEKLKPKVTRPSSAQAWFLLARPITTFLISHFCLFVCLFVTMRPAGTRVFANYIGTELHFCDLSDFYNFYIAFRLEIFNDDDDTLSLTRTFDNYWNIFREIIEFTHFSTRLSKQSSTYISNKYIIYFFKAPKIISVIFKHLC